MERMQRLGARSDVDSEEKPTSVWSPREDLSLVYNAVPGEKEPGLDHQSSCFCQERRDLGSLGP